MRIATASRAKRRSQIATASRAKKTGSEIARDKRDAFLSSSFSGVPSARSVAAQKSFLLRKFSNLFSFRAKPRRMVCEQILTVEFFFLF